MEVLKKDVLNKWLEIDCYEIALKLGFISQNTTKISETLILKTIRCLDHETTIPDSPNINYVITLVALMWEYADHSKYHLRKIAVKFLSRIGYSTSAIITDEKFDKNSCQFSSLESLLEELLATLNQENNNIEIKKNKFILTDFQMNLWKSMDTERLIGISAPTSAGKSFVILLKLLDKLTKENFNIIYIVPTLSLLNQVSEDFNKYIKALKIRNCKISNAYEEQDNENLNHIFVLTQEKAINIFSDKNNKFKRDTILVVDEIQNIERITDHTDERSKILYDALSEFRYKKNIKQIIISGPRINNVGETAETIFGRKAKKILSDDSPVLNLTYSIYKNENKQYQLKQYCNLRNIPFVIDITNSDFIKGYGQKTYKDNFLNYLNIIVKNLSSKQNIIFAPTSSTARKIACSLETQCTINKKIEELIDYYNKTVHPQYSLCNALNNGVTYHHGKLPHHVRRTLEKAMQENWINDIVCTTTLLQGINLPAQNIIIRNPNLYVRKSDAVTELSNYEMANLRGRAGRLLKDFIGRTFVLDESSFIITEGYDETSLFKDTTKELPMDYRERYEKYKEDIINSLLSNDDLNIEESKKEIHYKDMKTYIYQNILKHGEKAKQKMEKVGISLTKDQVAAIKLKLNELSIPKDLCYQNRYWDPFTLDYIYRNYNDEVPSFPLERGAKAKFDKMLKFLRDDSKTKTMYNRYVPQKLRKGAARGLLRDLCIEWAKENPLSEILSKRVKDNENPEDSIEDIIEILQNTASYNVPLLLKPIFDMKNPNSTFLTCMQAGACNEISKTLIEMGVPRECALYLNENLLGNKKMNDNIDLEQNLRDLLKTNFSNFPYWIQTQLEFLI